jgi:ABC-type Fe3+ transport system permease subunit
MWALGCRAYRRVLCLSAAAVFSWDSHGISEAAIITACGHFRIMSIILPLTKPALITMVLFTFILV